MNYLCQFCQQETINVPMQKTDIIWQDCLNCCNQNINIRYCFGNYQEHIEYLCMGIFFQDMPYSMDVWPEIDARPSRLIIHHHPYNNLYPYKYSKKEFERMEIFSSHNIPNINPLTIKEKLKTYLIFL